MGDFGSDAASNAGSLDAGSEKQEREPVTYIPEYEANEDEELYNDNHNTGIDFDKYFEIPTKVTGLNPEPKIKSFDQAELPEQVMKNIKLCGWSKPTPIQQECIPNILKSRDMMACAQTGSGKTGGYAIPIISHLIKEGVTAEDSLNDGDTPIRPHALIMAPTRELVQQIQKDFVKLCRGTPLKAHYVVGGHATKAQIEKLLDGCNILVATPGRLNDFVGKNKIDLNANMKYLILDEADRMLDMGFKAVIDGMAEKMAAKADRVTLMFSATFPRDVQELGKELLRDDYLFAAIGIVGGACTSVTQTILSVEGSEKIDKLKEIIEPVKECKERTLIFVETKKNADFLANKLSLLDFPSTSIHGNRSQQDREQALRDFKTGNKPILISTNVAARGIDIPDVAHVVNFDLPKEMDEYVHRIGRTGRCGHKGRSTSFYNEDKDSEMKPALINILTSAQQVMPDFLAGETGNAAVGGEAEADEDDEDGW